MLTGSFAEAAEETAVVKSFVDGTAFSSRLSCKHMDHGYGDLTNTALADKLLLCTHEDDRYL